MAPPQENDNPTFIYKSKKLMKLKNVLLSSDGSHRPTLKKFGDFIKVNCSKTPTKTEKEDDVQSKKKKKNSKVIPYDQLTLKQKEKRIKNMNHFLNGHSEYPV